MLLCPASDYSRKLKQAERVGKVPCVSGAITSTGKGRVRAETGEVPAEYTTKVTPMFH